MDHLLSVVRFRPLHWELPSAMSLAFPFTESVQSLMHVGAFGIACCIKSTSSPPQLPRAATYSLTARVLLWRADPLLATKYLSFNVDAACLVVHMLGPKRQAPSMRLAGDPLSDSSALLAYEVKHHDVPSQYATSST
jgi:hypothetical protein